MSRRGPTFDVYAPPLAAVFIAALGVLGAGHGFANGDAAVYVAQAQAGDLADRFVHVGWIALAWALAPLAGSALPAWLDLVNVLATVGVVLASARLARRDGASPGLAALLTAALAVPVASFAEVDVPWVLLVLLAGLAPGRLSPLPFALAVLLSPSALLALPWLLTRREARIPLLVATPLLVLALSVPHDGAWWVGERGVLRGQPPRPWASLQAWFFQAVPWLVVPFLRPSRTALATLPVLLAPPDTAAWVLPAAVLSASVRPPDPAALRRSLALAVAAHLTIGVVGWYGAITRVEAEMDVLRQLLATRARNDGLVATWSWGVRASVLATGQPYAPWWRVPDSPVRDQAAWCDRTFERVFVLPAGTRIPSVRDWHAVPSGVEWAAGDDPGWEKLPGCRRSGDKP